MTSSRCSSDPQPDPRRRPAERRARRVPVLLFGIAIGFALEVVLSRFLPDRLPAPARPVPAWFPVGGGEVEFLGDEAPFEIVREAGASAFRIVDPSGAAFENRRLEDVLRSWLREKLSGLRVGDSMVLRFRTDERGSWRRGGGAGRLERRIAVEEEKRDGETWYRASSGSTAADILVARSVEEAKEKAARELARELVVFYGAEPLQ